MEGAKREEAMVEAVAPADAVRASTVGRRVRAFRTARRMSLRRLGELTGTTASFVSQLERGLSGASVATLRRIADALGIRLPDLFEDDVAPGYRVLERADRPAIPMSHGCRKTLLSRPPLHEFEVYAGEFEVGGSTGPEPYVHGGAHEMFLVLRGEVELTLGAERFVLREGDSIEYATSTPHRTVNIGKVPAETLWIIAPPTSGPVELDQYTARTSPATGTDQAKSGQQPEGSLP